MSKINRQIKRIIMKMIKNDSRKDSVESKFVSLTGSFEYDGAKNESKHHNTHVRTINYNSVYVTSLIMIDRNTRDIIT